MHTSVILYAVALIIFLRLIFPFLSTFRQPFRSIPGPWYTRFSRFWYFQQVHAGEFEKTNILLHKKYGPVVRIAPDLYSITTLDKSVYGIKSKFTKSDWYEGWKHPAPDRWTLFTSRDIKVHAEFRRRFQHLYSMSSLISYESYVDDCTDIFISKLKEFQRSGVLINMGHWFQCYAFDVIGSITYSKRFGFLDSGEDVGGIISALGSFMKYGTLIGIYAWAHPFVYKITEKIPGTGAAGRNYLMRFVQDRVNDRKQERKGNVTSAEKRLEEGAGNAGEAKPEDFLNKVMDAQDRDPDKVNSFHVFSMGLSNITAGSDTTATSLSSILYHLIQHPAALNKLRQEIAQYEKEGRCGTDKISFTESQGMPYLQACMKEGMRLCPSVGLPLWRVVPPEGAEVQGIYLPGGTIVGINAWVTHYDEAIWGIDAKDFRPERWIEAEKEDPEKLKMMEEHWIPFGLGSRTCIGKHISILEMSKSIPRLVRDFDFELELSNNEWRTANYWFVKPVDFNVRVKPRT